jgi:hypothetical protein
MDEPVTTRAGARLGALVLLVLAGIAVTVQVTGARAAPSRDAVATPRSAIATASVPICSVARLSVVAGEFGEAGGQFLQTFTLTNLSSGACRLAGWPIVRVLDSSPGSPRSTKTMRVRQNTPPEQASSVVVLRPSRKASFDVYGADYDAVHNRACPQIRAAVITPPATAGQLRIAVRLPDCGTLLIAPVIGGASDRPSWSEYVH